jgi:hypothetical protein
LSNKVGDNIQQSMGVDNSESRCGGGSVRNVLIGTLSEIFNHIRKEFELID